MNYYIDLDSTLYDTTSLVNDMLYTIAKNICELTQKGVIEDRITELRSMFNRENYYNIYKLATYFADKNNIEHSILINSVENVILDGKKYVYEDVIDFLKELKEKGHNINILTFVAQEDLSYQLTKIKGSGLSKYIDNIIITSNLKFNLDIEYNKGIFIDDNPNDLIGLASRNPKTLIRMKRKNTKYYTKEVNIDNLIEIECFKEIIKTLN
ncbi:MAG: HAD family hydrolase [Clostridia bacterium]|nr:HAD family hydrolase [Clostridia bacterium]